MKVSIITVTYNAEKTIENSIKAVISQTYNDIEYLIIDGGSTDRTVSIIEKYKDKIAYFVSETDNGVYNAMNKGITASTGEILYFINANDYIFDENVIKETVEAFKKTKVDMIFGNMSFIDDEGTEKERKSYATADMFFLTQECICHQGIFYRRKVFDICGLYNENYHLMADHDLNMKIIMNKKLKVGYFDRVVSKFTLGGLSNSAVTLTILNKEKEELLSKYFTPYHIKANKILNKTFRNIARNPKLRKITGKLLGFSFI